MRDTQVQNTWFFDLRTSCHMTSNIDWFTKYDTLFNVKPIFLCGDIGKNTITI